MTSYVLVFRMPNGAPSTPEQDAAWGAWFQTLGGVVADFGHHAGHTTTLGAGSAQALGGYVIINADDMSHATDLAKGRPGLHHGGSVEIGDTVEAA